MPFVEDMEPNVGYTESEEGAVLLNSGYALLGRILAGAGEVKFSKAALDSGELPDGTAVEDLTAPCQYAGGKS